MALGYEAVAITAQLDGAALTASTTATSLLPGQSKPTLPAQFFDRVGKMIKVTARGRISNIVTTPGTITLDIRLGSVIVATSQALQLNAVAKTNVTFSLEWLLTARAVGASTTANLMHTAVFTSEAVVGAGTGAAGSTGNGVLLIPASAPAVGTGFDSTAAQVLDLFGTFSLNNANSIQVHQFLVEDLN